MREEERKKEKRWSFLAHHPDDFLAKLTEKHSILLKAVPINPTEIEEQTSIFIILCESFQKPQISKSPVPEGYVMHPFPADKRTWTYSRWRFMIGGNIRWRHWGLPPHPYSPWEQMEFKEMDIQPLPMVSCQSSAPESIMINADPPPGACVGRSYCFSWRVTIVSMCNRSPPTFLKSSGIAWKTKPS